MIDLEIYNKTKAKISPKIFKDLLADVKKYLVKDGTVSAKRNFSCELTLVGNAEITKLNAEYHGKNRPTDVVSVSYFEAERKSGHPDFFSGEIFISVPYARAQAKKIRQSLSEELRFLFVHGILHVFGYDHMKPKEEAEMLRLTYGILGRK